MHDRYTGEIVSRTEPCRLCGETTGKLISVVDYWDIRKASIIKCEKCGLAQLDPMLTEEDTAKGCLAYYIEETLRTPVSEQRRNLIRNFRRGVVFGYSLSGKGYHPEKVLEFGPGSGYFLEGLKFVFPDMKITVVDINQEVLDLNEKQHGYNTMCLMPETFTESFRGEFDLIIARDLIEHVADISKVFENVAEYLKPGGLFHFITPNGAEDLWKYYLTYKYLKKNPGLLINHVNYFDGKGLREYLEHHNFDPVSYYTYTFKTTFRGEGWKRKRKLMAEVSSETSSGFYINEKISGIRNYSFNKAEILDEWYIGRKIQFITYLVSLFHHSVILRINPRYNKGHEIYGLFKVRK